MKKIFFLLVLVGLMTSGCYSFRGIDIDPDVRTYEVAQFKNNALNAPPTLAQTFTEVLKEKIRTESRLVYQETGSDIVFDGSIVDFRVTSEAPAPGEFTALNRLTINVAVSYTNTKHDDKSWNSNFSYFFDFPSSTDLASIQDEAIDEIINQLTEDIFNKAFTNW